ncbi:hypothetical protein SEA_KIDNEYBEAN_78 [Gordonia phage KidneyBean]|uniref:Uncharacterized protein n=1 Tax=Gordonia phage KidneyBean TaxID=2301603 RepID=A0A385UFW5_9CAUD|nr:hypothetical protein KNU11_gp78 [Gordonia phage KidneyBean]AYB69810.1 hypothetical protein SEA_KIDNEYBEAN_78 [Gordonia phage KidneyBean]QOP66739.1 hypothetical protein SEA_NOVUMREGINA_78 [Gordonia phage NovumRegina]QOR55920.1 hypothetical protein SEA_GROOTJR_80 [Gordonia phage GrootJr]
MFDRTSVRLGPDSVRPVARSRCAARSPYRVPVGALTLSPSVRVALALPVSAVLFSMVPLRRPARYEQLYPLPGNRRNSRPCGRVALLSCAAHETTVHTRDGWRQTRQLRSLRIL